MKKIPVLLAIIAIAVVAYSMSNWSGSKSVVATKHVTTETRTVSDFTKIDVESIFQVDVTYSNEESVTVEAPDNLQKYIELKVKSGTLKVQFDSKTSITSTCAIKVHIKTAKLNDFTLSGASSITLNNSLNDDNFTVESSGAASFKGEVDVEKATIELSGAANIDLFGTATTADLDLSGASHLNDYDFKVDNLNIDLSGASSATITSLKTINGELSGASSLNYKGNPSIKRLSTSGASNAYKH
ncbi:MAG: DUF2807 domain-containing protein [Crocinitomicaceae bacterium]|nr:DUF2807 domain-containing protein [Flavobacteriales bacterium]NQZ36627.1 DUF2807 domain-containing protein [Crocinitomicaceae bacterium]